MNAILSMLWSLARVVEEFPVHSEARKLLC